MIYTPNVPCNLISIFKLAFISLSKGGSKTTEKMCDLNLYLKELKKGGGLCYVL